MPKNMTEEQRKKWNEYQRMRRRNNKELQQAAVEYTKERQVNFSLSLSRQTEQDLIDYLNQFPNKSAYLKALVRADMDAHAQKNDNNETN